MHMVQKMQSKLQKNVNFSLRKVAIPKLQSVTCNLQSSALNLQNFTFRMLLFLATPWQIFPAIKNCKVIYNLIA